jgi:hypothetical protein
MEKAYTTDVKLAKKAGNIKANVKVTSGVLTMRLTLVEKDEKLYLNPPAKFVESLKSEDNNGFINHGWIAKESFESVREEIVAKYNELLKA